MTEKDPVNPQHYRNSKGVQLIDIIRYMPFSLGNTLKYCYRNENKNNAVEDLKKALWYLNDYKNHQEILSSFNALKEENFNIVFEGVSDWEKDCCYKLFIIYKEIGRSHILRTYVKSDFDRKIEEVEKIIEDRITDLNSKMI